MPKELPSPEMLRKLLRYEPETGKLFWRERSAELFEDKRQPSAQSCKNWNKRWAGKEAFTSHTNYGYKQGSIFNRKYQAHRVIFAMHSIDCRAAEIDHINGVRDDNRLVNLRAVSRWDNARNCGRASDNTSGCTGVSWDRSRGKWVAYIKARGKVINLGRFIKIEDAIAARKAAEKQYGYHKNHGRG
jgi:hypothetical protein